MREPGERKKLLPNQVRVETLRIPKEQSLEKNRQSGQVVQERAMAPVSLLDQGDSGLAEEGSLLGRDQQEVIGALQTDVAIVPEAVDLFETPYGSADTQVAGLSVQEAQRMIQARKSLAEAGDLGEAVEPTSLAEARKPVEKIQIAARKVLLSPVERAKALEVEQLARGEKGDRVIRSEDLSHTEPVKPPVVENKPAARAPSERVQVALEMRMFELQRNFSDIIDEISSVMSLHKTETMDDAAYDQIVEAQQTALQDLVAFRQRLEGELPALALSPEARLMAAQARNVHRVIDHSFQTHLADRLHAAQNTEAIVSVVAPLASRLDGYNSDSRQKFKLTAEPEYSTTFKEASSYKLFAAFRTGSSAGEQVRFYYDEGGVGDAKILARSFEKN